MCQGLPSTDGFLASALADCCSNDSPGTWNVAVSTYAWQAMRAVQAFLHDPDKVAAHISDPE